MSNFVITFSDDSLSFGKQLIEDKLTGLVANIDGTDYVIKGTDYDGNGHTSLLLVQPFDEERGEGVGATQGLVLYTCVPGRKEIETIKIY